MITFTSKLLTSQALAKLFGLHPLTIADHRVNRGMPAIRTHNRKGSGVRYLDEIKAMGERNKRIPDKHSTTTKVIVASDYQ